MTTHFACIASFAVVAACSLGGCKSTEQRAWLVEGPSNSVMLGMVSTPAAAHEDATGMIMLGAGDALGFQLYMNHVAYVHATADFNDARFATGSNDQPQD